MVRETLPGKEIHVHPAMAQARPPVLHAQLQADVEHAVAGADWPDAGIAPGAWLLPAHAQHAKEAATVMPVKVKAGAMNAGGVKYVTNVRAMPFY